MSSHNETPINPLPPVVIALFLVLMGIEAVLSLGSAGLIGGPEAVGWRLGALQGYGFSSDVFQWMWATWQFPPEHAMRFVSYLFVQGSFTSALFAGVMVLALGKFVGEVFSGWAVVMVFIVSGIGGAVAHGVFITAQPWLFGAFPGVYGLIGAFTFLLWTRLAGTAARQAQAFSLIGLLMGLQLLFGLVFGTDSMWLADLFGFFTGFGLSFFLAPGGWAKILARLRQGS